MRIVALLAMLVATPAWTGEIIRVAVAANFKPTLRQISTQFETATGHKVVLSSASTGVLYSQIVNGAPYQLFFAADADSPRRLAAGSRSGPDPFCYAVGRLALVGGNGTLARLADPQYSLAIANPATAPYGRAAQQVLDRIEFRPGLDRKLVRGNNVAQAYSSGTAARWTWRWYRWPWRLDSASRYQATGTTPWNSMPSHLNRPLR